MGGVSWSQSFLSDEFLPNGVTEHWADWLHEAQESDDVEQRIRCQTREIGTLPISVNLRLDVL